MKIITRTYDAQLTQNKLEILDDQEVIGEIYWTESLTVCDFYDFIYRQELDEHFGEIANAWIKLRRQA